MRVPCWIWPLIVFTASAQIVFSQTKDQEKPAPSGQVFFGKFEPGKITEVYPLSVLKTDSLHLVVPKGVVSGKIVQFDVYISQGRTGISETAFGNRLSKKQKALIDNLVNGAVFSIQKIVVKYPGKDKQTIGTKFSFKVRK